MSRQPQQDQAAADAVPAPPAEVLELQRSTYGGLAVLVAMDEEAAPFLETAEQQGDPVDFGRARYWALRHGSLPVLLVRTGIGLANAASAATTAITLVAPRAVVSAGSAGGLRADVEVGDLVVSERVAYADADATAFGYVRGQVPGMPEEYSGDAVLLERACEIIPVGAELPSTCSVRTGQMLAGGSFVTAANVADTRQMFPEALSTDMETAAIAQVTHGFGVPFLAVRGISDLCGPAADQDFHLAVEVVAERSARAVLSLFSEPVPEEAAPIS